MASVLGATVLYAGAPVSGYKIVKTFPHSRENYTEGLFYKDGLLYEGTGLKGQSALLVTQLETGKTLQHVDLPPDLFGEGIVDWGSTILQWTWQTNIGIIYDAFSLHKIRQFTYEGEGWGMTRTERYLITSDGTAVLRFRDPQSFAEVKHVVVRDEGNEVSLLNELEFIDGEIYANVWHTDRIARISPRDGRVLSWIDLSGILPASEREGDDAVLNGIAYDAKGKRLFVTGKQWPSLFQIVIVKK